MLSETWTEKWTDDTNFTVLALLPSKFLIKIKNFENILATVSSKITRGFLLFLFFQWDFWLCSLLLVR